MLKKLLIVIVAIQASACAALYVSPPVEYSAQSFIRIGNGKIRMGSFEYLPAVSGKLKNNEVPVAFTPRNLYLSGDISKLAKRATMLEFDRSGLTIVDSAKKEVRAEIFELKATGGFSSFNWVYKVRYGLYDLDSGKELINKIYEADKIKSDVYDPVYVNKMIRNALEKFMQDVKDLKIFPSK